MPITRPGSSRPLPRFTRRRRGRAARIPAAGQSLAQMLGTWGFAVQVYISFDAPGTTNPTWLEVTGYVHTDSITITRGRQDGLSDVSAGTCSLTADNSDGRWTPSNPGGAWFGLIRKGAWLRVDLLPPSGTVSTRFTGFITSLPTGWAGLYASTRITASDRFLLLGQAPQLPAMTSAEVLYDTSTGMAQATATGPGVLAHYPLSEAQSGSPGSTVAPAFGDISGNLSPPLVPVPWGSTNASYLSYIKAQGTQGPGFDSQQALQLTPASLSSGTALTTTVAPWNTYNGPWSYGVVELWIQTTFVGTTQPFATLYDPVGGGALVFGIDATTGYLTISFQATLANSSFGSNNLATLIPGTSVLGGTVQAGVVLNDGNWHYVSLATDVLKGGTDSLFFVINIDGKTVWIPSIFAGTSTSTNMNTLVIGGGFSGTTPQCFTGNIAGVSWILTGLKASNYPAHYLAGYNGFYSESADVRIARVARYAGIPEPTSLQAPAVGYNPVPIYTPGLKVPWTNLSACVHQVGTQSIVGRQPLDVMREAARTENMPLYISRDGYLTIQPSTARYNTTSAWSVDSRDVDPATSFPDDFTYLVNQIQVTPNGGATQTVNGAAGTASQNKYGVYSQSLATASANATDAANAALAQVNANADPVPRLAPLVLDNVATLAGQAGYGNAWYDALLATDISTVITVTNLPSQAPASSLSVFVEGYTETISAGQHAFSFSTSPQTNASVFQLDTSTLDTPSITLPY